VSGAAAIRPRRSLNDKNAVAPERTAVRTALWRALHLEVDAPPILHDDIGLKLLEPAGVWRERHDMLPGVTARSRATVVARARFIEDLVAEWAARGVTQYVLLGAGLDTFAFRRPSACAGVTVFEIDQPGPQEWKRRKLDEFGFGVPSWLKLVPVDFETSGGWKERLADAGFDARRPAVVASTGVAAFLTREALASKLAGVAALAPGTVFAMSFSLPIDRLDAGERAARQKTEEFARAAGTPWLTVLPPDEMMALARAAGFRKVRHVSAADLTALYFANRADGLRPSSGEELLVGTVEA
jgi:methyltransferase (TIGR00027 family)